MKISYSALETFENCPKKYEFKYVDKIKAPKSKEQILGTAIHSALKYFHSKIPQPNLNELIEYFKEHWTSSEEIWQDEQEEKAFLQQGLEMLRNYYQKNYSKNFIVVDLETRVEAEIKESDHPEAETHFIIGQIDRIDKISDNFFEIIDYKTTKKMPSLEKVSQNMQLGVYSLGFLKRWPNFAKAKLKLSLYYLKHSEKLSFLKNDNFLKETKEKILNIIKKIEKGYFLPTPNPLCDYCPYKQICPMWKNLYQKETPSKKEVLKMAKEYLTLKKSESQNKQKLAILRKEINKYLEDKGLERLFVEEGYITRVPQKRENYDFEKIKKILLPLGLWENILEVSRPKFNELLKNLPKDILEKIKKEAKLEDKEFKVFKASFKKIKPPKN